MLSTWVWFPVFGDADPVKVLIMSIFVVFATIYLAYGKFEPENTLVRRKLGMVVAQKNPEFLIFRRGPVTEN